MFRIANTTLAKSILNGAHRMPSGAPLRSGLRFQFTSGPGTSRTAFRGGVLAAAAIGGSALGYLLGDMHRGQDDVLSKVEEKVIKATFSATAKLPNGGKKTTEHALLNEAEVEKRLTGNATSKIFPGSNFSDVVRYDNNFVECLEPIEDRHMNDAFPATTLFGPGAIAPDGVSGGIKLFSVLDGHGGWECSDAVSKTLHPVILKSLQSLYAGNIPPSKRYQPYAFASGLLPTYVSALSPENKSISPLLPPLNITPANVKASLTAAFLALDQEIVTAATRLIDPKTGGLRQGVSHALANSVIRVGNSGACALNLMVDEAEEQIYVSNIGDCRAVAGYWVESKEGVPGGWRCEVLSQDHTTRSEAEVRRMRSEHPKSEADNIIWSKPRVSGGTTYRLMGGLIPIRTFGDSIYKWTMPETEALQRIAPDAVPPYPPQPHIKTPPYVTARPEIVYKKMSADDKNGELRFIILATDGLWDTISSQDSVALTGAFLDKQQTELSRKKLNRALLPEPVKSLARYAPNEWPSEGDKWTLKDENAATHLIRNAYSNYGKHPLRELLSFRAPHAKTWRDDVTCSVVFFKGKSGDHNDTAATETKA